MLGAVVPATSIPPFRDRTLEVTLSIKLRVTLPKLPFRPTSALIHNVGLVAHCRLDLRLRSVDYSVLFCSILQVSTGKEPNAYGANYLRGKFELWGKKNDGLLRLSISMDTFHFELQ